MRTDQRALLRHARRAFRQNLRRNLLIVAVIALSVGLAITVASAQRSLTVTSEERGRWELGDATAVLVAELADELGLVVTEELAVLVLEAPPTRQEAVELDALFHSSERFGQARFPFYSLVLGEERDSVAKRVQWIAVAVALGVAVLIGGCTTALAAAESDRDVLTMVSVGGAPSLRRRFLGLQSAYHAGVGTVLALPVVALLLWALYRGDVEPVGLVFPALPLLAVVVGIPIALGLVTRARGSFG